MQEKTDQVLRCFVLFAALFCPSIFQEYFTADITSKAVGSTVTLTCTEGLLFSTRRQSMTIECVQVVGENFVKGEWSPKPEECMGELQTFNKYLSLTHKVPPN